MLFNLLLIVGVALLSLSLRSFLHPVAQKLGALGVLATSFLTGWLVTDSWMAGVLCALSWFLLPWVEILTRVRKLTLPLEKSLIDKRPPSRDAFPTLPFLTEELEEEGFEQVEDCGWDWEDYEQFFRLFYHQTARTQGAICLIEQHGVAFYYLSLSSRGKDGRIWTTWNYPFSYSLKLVPQWRVNRLRGEPSFLELHASHEEFLLAHGVEADQLEALDSEKIHTEIQEDLRSQIIHNIDAGVLTLAASGEARYSWRGLFFVWFQFLRDLVRLS